MADFAEEEEEQRGVDVPEAREGWGAGGGTGGFGRVGLGFPDACELFESCEVEACDEEDFLVEREGVEIAESMGEVSWGEEEREAAALVEAEVGRQ